MNRATSQTFSRGLAVLADLNQFNGATVAEIAARTGIHRVIVNRLLATLADDGFVRREGRPTRHYLNAAVQSLADGFVADAWVDDVARPLIADLGRRIVWPLSLAIPAGSALRVCVVTDPESPLTRRRIPLGFRIPMMESAAGLAFLAASDAASRHTIVDLCLKEQGARANLGQLATRLTETRNRGYGLWHSAEKVTQIAVPVLVRRRPVAVLAVRYYSSALPLARAVAAFLPELKTCAGDIGRALETPVR